MIRIEQTQDAQEFLNLNEDILLKNESMNNLMLGLANGAVERPDRFQNAFFVTVYENENIIGQSVRTHGDRPLMISEMPKSAINELANYIFKIDPKLFGVVGEKNSSTSFKKQWQNLGKFKIRMGMHQGIYELEKVIMPNIGNGSLVTATIDHTKIAERFLEGFIRDCFPSDKKPKEKAQAMFKRFVEDKTLFLWKNENSEIVSMAAKNRESRNAATISMVYTPNEHRGKGYGSIVTALVSKRMLDEGKKKCNLFTDLSNSTSNSIYQKIGYRMIGESMHYNFEV
ncbi:MAG: GNAT family N-acetyltransferase [Oligoflexia bacterium]|nr:GNAT family N-acetyltransferase [Oligoflexia bacterium]